MSIALKWGQQPGTYFLIFRFLQLKYIHGTFYTDIIFVSLVNRLTHHQLKQHIHKHILCSLLLKEQVNYQKPVHCLFVTQTLSNLQLCFTIESRLERHIWPLVLILNKL